MKTHKDRDLANMKKIMKMKKLIKKTVIFSVITGLTTGITYSPAWSLTYEIPAKGNVVGKYKEVESESGETLLDIAMRYDIGMYEIYKANPRLPRKGYLHTGTNVIIPARFVLPSGSRQGIVLNLAHMRVYYYHDGQVSTYPVGVGRSGWSTPTGSTRITSKVRGPTWTPTPSIRREAARKGRTLRASYPPGPKNPLGPYAMHLGFKGILMHGTIAPRSIGLRSSHGCIRLFNRDITELFSMVPVGTSVRVVYEPFGD